MNTTGNLLYVRWQQRLARLAAGLGFGLMLCSAPSQALDIQPQVQAQLRISEPKARQFNQAMAAIASLAGKPLSADKDYEAAVALIEKQQPGVRNSFDVLVVTASANKEFVAGVQQAAEKEGADALMARLKKNPAGVLKIPGAQAVLARTESELQQHGKALKAVQAQLEQAQAASEKSCVGDAEQFGRQWKPEAGAGKTSAPGLPTPAAPALQTKTSLLERPAGLLRSSAAWLVDGLVPAAAAQDSRMNAGSRPMSEQDRQAQGLIIVAFLWLKQELKDATPPADGGPSPQQQCYTRADAAHAACSAGCPASARASCRGGCALGCNLNPFANDKQACTNSCLSSGPGRACTGTARAACGLGCSATWTGAIAVCLTTPQS